MEKDLMKAFTYDGEQVRTVTNLSNNETMFCLKDICNVLGKGKVADVVKRLDDDEVDLIDVVDSIGKTQQMTFVTESGMYNVILRSNSPKAQPFRKWVTSEVLPTLRKDGMYAVGEKQMTVFFVDINSLAQFL